MVFVGTFSKSIFNYFATHNHSNFELIYLETAFDKRLKKCHYIITGSISVDQMDKAVKLKAIFVPYTGLNGLPLDEIKRRGIKVYNTHAHSKYVAEKAVSLTFALTGKVVKFHNKMTMGDWSNRTNINREKWFSMFGKKIGLYGYGHIGKEIHELLLPFGCEFHTLDRNRVYNDIIVHHTLEDLIRHVDLLYVCVPYTNNTKNSIGHKELDLLKDKYLVNVGRGNIIIEKELYDALLHRKIRGYASDVWYQYPSRNVPSIFPSVYPIHDLDNVVMSPHCGSFADTSKDEVMKDVYEKVTGVINNKAVEEIHLDAFV
jgi:phosphoglycerate dehydrogenase-like enzyme